MGLEDFICHPRFTIGRMLAEDIHVYGELTREKIGSILRKRKLKTGTILDIKKRNGSYMVEMCRDNTFLNIYCGSVADNVKETTYYNDGIPWDEH